MDCQPEGPKKDTHVQSGLQSTWLVFESQIPGSGCEEGGRLLSGFRISGLGGGVLGGQLSLTFLPGPPQALLKTYAMPYNF